MASKGYLCERRILNTDADSVFNRFQVDRATHDIVTIFFVWISGCFGFPASAGSTPLYSPSEETIAKPAIGVTKRPFRR